MEDAFSGEYVSVGFQGQGVEPDKTANSSSIREFEIFMRAELPHAMEWEVGSGLEQRGDTRSCTRRNETGKGSVNLTSTGGRCKVRFDFLPN